MSKAYEFLKECGSFFVLTINGDYIAQKPNSMEWIRITGIATECTDKALRQKMYEETPILQKHHASAEAEHFLMFKIAVENVEIK